MRIIGDVHGKIEGYKKIIAECDESIQIGDMSYDYSVFDAGEIDYNHKFFMGNHDNWKWSPYHSPSNCLNIFGNHRGYHYISGAQSIDWELRYRDFLLGGKQSFLNDEEPAIEYGSKILQSYKQCKDEIIVMLSHDCPSRVVEYVSSSDILPKFGFARNYTSATQILLDECFKVHKPKLWIFGHHHRNRMFKYDDTLFICLAELSYVDVEISGDEVYLNGSKIQSIPCRE